MVQKEKWDSLKALREAKDVLKINNELQDSHIFHAVSWYQSGGKSCAISSTPEVSSCNLEGTWCHWCAVTWCELRACSLVL